MDRCLSACQRITTVSAIGQMDAWDGEGIGSHRKKVLCMDSQGPVWREAGRRREEHLKTCSCAINAELEHCQMVDACTTYHFSVLAGLLDTA